MPPFDSTVGTDPTLGRFRSIPSPETQMRPLMVALQTYLVRVSR